MKLAVIVGAGGVLGAALAREFTQADYSVVGLRRRAVEPASIYNYQAIQCDLGDAVAIRDAVTRVINAGGGIDTLVLNTANFVSAPFAHLEVSDFEAAWGAAIPIAVNAIQAALPAMLEQGRGTILFSGATASVRGGAGFAAFAAAKFALRGLAQSLAREYQPRGIHVAHVVIDGVLSRSAAAQRFAVEHERAIDPADVARTYRWLAEQPRSTWTHELDLRPHTERFS
jgi:NAD(P)-dependent dehydrogenase (short-subunit alcohol dehydrogenase family)